MWVRGLLRAVSIVAATALSRAAALRPRVLGTTLATAAAARNRHTPHVRGGIIQRRRLQENCPVEDCCPAKLEPIPSAECPPPDSGDVARFSCDAPDLVEGNLCRSNAGECGTDKNLDNCEYPETKLKADIYRVVEARPVAPSPRPTSICPELIPLEKDSPDCPDELEGGRRGHGLRLGLGPGQPHLSARAHVVAPSAYLHNAASPAPPESLVRAIYSPGRHT